MVYKLIGVCTVSMFFLIGCGDNSAKEENHPEENVLTVRAEGFNEKIKVDLQQGDYSLTAKANDNDAILYINRPRDPSDKYLFGSLILSENNEASFSSLTWENKFGLSTLLCLDQLSCKKNTQYGFNKINQILRVHFKNSSSRLFKDYLEGGADLGKTIPGSISGDLVLKIPPTWLAFNQNRFPAVQGKGYFSFDGEKYKLFDIKSDVAFYKDDNNEYIGAVDRFYFKSGNKTVDFEIYEGVKGNDAFKEPRIRLFQYSDNDGGDFVSSTVPASSVLWGDDGKKISININRLELYEKEKRIYKTLDVKFEIPRNTSNIEVNGEKTLLSTSSYDFAYVYNDQKKYAIGLRNNSKSYFLNIIQEINGGITLESDDGVEKKACGGRESSCRGLSMDLDNKTFKFENVKLGKDVLNGTIYFAGVLDSK